MGRVFRGALIPLALVVSWEGFSRAGLLPMDSLSRPSLIVRAGVGALRDGSLLLATWQTVQAALVGFLVAAVLGILAGVALGLSRRLEGIVGPTIEALRPIPSVALIPLSLMVFGFGLRLEAAVIAFACLWPILLVTVDAVHNIEPRLLELGRVLELKFSDRLFKIILPAVFARVSIGLRVAVGIALVVAVTVEIVINPRGLGYGMIMAQQSLKPELMYAQLFWLGALGWGGNFLMQKAVAQWPGMSGPGGSS